MLRLRKLKKRLKSIRVKTWSGTDFFSLKPEPACTTLRFTYLYKITNLVVTLVACQKLEMQYAHRSTN